MTAAEWFLDQGDVVRSLDLATEADDMGMVERTLRSHGLGLLLAGAGATVHQSVTRLLLARPASPTGLALRALLAVEAGDRATADESLTELRAVPEDGDATVTSLRAAAALHRTRLAADTPLEDANALERGSGPTPPEQSDPDLRLLLIADRGALRLYEGDALGARADLEHVVGVSAARGLHWLQFQSRNLIPGTHLVANDLASAHEAAAKAIAFARVRGWDRSASLAYSFALAGWSSFHALLPEEAADWAAIAVDTIDDTVDVEIQGTVRTCEAIIAFDEPDERRAALERLERTTSWLAQRASSPTLTAMAAAHELRMCFELGEWHRAELAVERAGKRLGPCGDVRVLAAQLAAARGRPTDARRWLAPVLTGELRPLRSTAITTAWLLEALLFERAERRPAATAALLNALDSASRSAALRPFLDAGEEVHAMLGRHRDRVGHHETLLHSVLAGIANVVEWQRNTPDTSTSGPVDAGSEPLPLGLTQRELSILRQLPSMSTLTEIAAAQGISLNTVKTHVRAIYLKFGATTRRETVTMARAMGLI